LKYLKQQELRVERWREIVHLRMPVWCSSGGCGMRRHRDIERGMLAQATALQLIVGF
jgi:hypothetical protein